MSRCAAAAGAALALLAACGEDPAALLAAQAAADRTAAVDRATWRALDQVVAAARGLAAGGGGLPAATAEALEALDILVDVPAFDEPAPGDTPPPTGTTAGDDSEPDAAKIPVVYVSGETTTPWQISLTVPRPDSSGDKALWAAAALSPAWCRAVVLDPDYGVWGGLGRGGLLRDCDSDNATDSYAAGRGLAGDRDNYTWVAIAEADLSPPAVPPGAAADLDDAAGEVLATVTDAARRLIARHRDPAAANIAHLSQLALTVTATADVAAASGAATAPVTISDGPSQSPWEASIAEPDATPRDPADTLWAAAARSPLACRAVVLDPDYGTWRGDAPAGRCVGSLALRSYTASRGTGGAREGFIWRPAEVR